MNEQRENDLAEAEIESSRDSSPKQTDILCLNCNSRLSPEQKFCHNCGCRVEKNENHSAITVQNNVHPKKEIDKHFVIDIIKSSLILAMAVFMLIAAFLPVMVFEKEYNGKDVSVTFNAIDGIHMFGNSLMSLDSDDIEDSLLDIIEDMSEYSEEWENDEELDKLPPYLKDVIKVSLQSEEINTSFGITLVAILSLAQIILAILFAVFASISFASLFKRKLKDFRVLSLVLMGMYAIVSFTNAYAFKISSDWNSANTKIAAIPICALIFTLVIMAGFFVLRLTVNKSKISAREIITVSFSLFFAIVLLCSTFAPIVDTEVKTVFSSSKNFMEADEPKSDVAYLSAQTTTAAPSYPWETAPEPDRASSPLDASVFYSFELTDSLNEQYEELDDYDDADKFVQSSFEGFENFTRREFKNGKAEQFNKEIYSILLFAYGGYSANILFSFGTVAMILIVLFALFFIWKNMFELSTGSRISLAISLPAEIITAIMAAFVVTMAIVMSVIVNHNADVADVIYHSQIAYGPILMFICTIGVAVVPPAKKMKRTPNAFIDTTSEI